MPPMRVGGKRTVVVPSRLAFGAAGSGFKGGPCEKIFQDCPVPPDSPVELTIELIDVKDAFTDGPEGVRYRDVEVGKGEIAEFGDGIVMNYYLRATGSAGAEQGTNFLFTAGSKSVILGYNLGLLGGRGMPPMREGGEREVFIPPQLGYGAEGKNCRGGKVVRVCTIRPDSTLALNIKLVSVTKRNTRPTSTTTRATTTRAPTPSASESDAPTAALGATAAPGGALRLEDLSIENIRS
eukprot:gnl/TRDRNA2_/TRDRNA2_89445_c0_seq2.p1 gnl/TRDRNA2_/TRDRNA2_89445_c0~~gnl/TRDRNA2_/TRDRNA2_89445_c0_seq2.p1  ORF type:complete len:238 (+),score=32.54 gnl/TRDRNA2_/TRDRNA2_89445_c0_seq2:302-1015(+)